MYYNVASVMISKPCPYIRHNLNKNESFPFSQYFQEKLENNVILNIENVIMYNLQLI